MRAGVNRRADPRSTRVLRKVEAVITCTSRWTGRPRGHQRGRHRCYGRAVTGHGEWTADDEGLEGL